MLDKHNCINKGNLVFLTYKTIEKAKLKPYNQFKDCRGNPISSPNTLFRKRLHPLQFLSFFADL